jgi:cobalt/nickel transport system permease protein
MQKAMSAMREMLALEEMAAGDTWAHRIHPAYKLAATLVYIVCVVSVRRLDFVSLSPFFFYPALLVALSEIPVRAVLRRAALALPFVLFAGVSNFFFEPIGNGLSALAVLLEKAVLTVSAVVILMATTPSPRLFSAMRKLGAPRALVTVLMLAARYLTLIAGEAGRMARAYRMRAGTEKGILMKDMGSFVGQLLLRSVDRAERVYAAMKLRGYDGDFPTGAAQKTDGASVVFFLIVCASSMLLRVFPMAELMKIRM